MSHAFQALKQIMTPEFQPYVVFIAAPSVDVMRAMSQLAYQHYVVSVVKTVSCRLVILDKNMNTIKSTHTFLYFLSIVDKNL